MKVNLLCRFIKIQRAVIQRHTQTDRERQRETERDTERETNRMIAHPTQGYPSGYALPPSVGSGGGAAARRHLDGWMFWVALTTLLITAVAFAIHVVNTVRVTNLEDAVESKCGPGVSPLYQTGRASNRFSLPLGSYRVSVPRGGGGGGGRNLTYFCHGDLNNGTVGYFLVHEGPDVGSLRVGGGEEGGSIGVTELPVVLPVCCTFIREGTRWMAGEGYGVDPSNNRGLGPQFIASSFDEAARVWEDAAGSDVFGNRRTIPSSAGLAFNGLNEVAFGRIDVPGFSNVLAVTGIWVDCATRDGSTGTCTSSVDIIEWDQLYNTFSFDWGDADSDGNSVVDLLNIVVHEMGHSLGLGDLYSPSSCRQSTMWGFSGEGETKKRSLEPDDSECARILYSGEATEGGGGDVGSAPSGVKVNLYGTCAFASVLLSYTSLANL